MMRVLVVAVSALAIFGACSGRHPAREPVAVTYLDGHREGGVVATVQVPVAESVKEAASTWNASVEDDGCEADGRALVLTPRMGRGRVLVGEPCAWDDSPGFVSPDGQYLAAFVLGDGSGAELHLVGLGPSPTDLGVVSGSKSSNRSATWTRDGRLWFTSDATAAMTNKIFGYRPADKDSISIKIPKAEVVTNVTAEL